MVRLELPAKVQLAHGEPTKPRGKVEPELLGTGEEIEGVSDLAQANTAHWYYRMTAPGVRYYFYQGSIPS